MLWERGEGKKEAVSISNVIKELFYSNKCRYTSVQGIVLYNGHYYQGHDL